MRNYKLSARVETQQHIETVPCPVCHTLNSKTYLRVPDRFALEKGNRFSLVQCQECTLIYLSPRPVEEASAAFYENEEYTPFVSAQSTQSGFDKIYQRIRKYNNSWKRRLIERNTPEKGSLLDVGCGTGEFIAEMARSGWQTRGLERDPKAAAYAVDGLGLDVVRGTLDTIASQPETYDVVTMWHVLEHLYDPHKALMQIHDMLKIDGLLAIAVPNANSLDARFYQENWVAYDTPRHLLHFTLKSLRSLCEMHNFTLVTKMLLPVDSYFNALMSERLMEKRGNRSEFFKILHLMRASVIANTVFLLGKLSNLTSHPVGSTLLLILKK